MSINSSEINSATVDGTSGSVAGYRSLFGFWLGGLGAQTTLTMSASLAETDTFGLTITLAAGLNETDTLSGTGADYATPMAAALSETDTIDAALLGQMQARFGEFDILSGELAGGLSGGKLPLWRRRK